MLKWRLLIICLANIVFLGGVILDLLDPTDKDSLNSKLTKMYELTWLIGVCVCLCVSLCLCVRARVCTCVCETRSLVRRRNSTLTFWVCSPVSAGRGQGLSFPLPAWPSQFAESHKLFRIVKTLKTDRCGCQSVDTQRDISPPSAREGVPFA